MPIRLAIFCFLSAAAVLLPGLGNLVMERQQELRVALCAKNMVDLGNWLVPEFQNNTRLNKPPLMYWLSAASFKAFGDTRSAAAARLPSVITGLALLLLIAQWTWELYGRRTAGLAVMMLSSSFIFIKQARLAETDVTLLFFTSAAIYCVYKLMRNPRLHTWLLLGLCMGLGFFTKGPAAVLFPLLYGIFFLLKEKRTPRPKQSLFFLICLTLTFAIAAPWYIYISGLEVAEEALSKELSNTYIKTYHPGSIFYYFYSLPLAMLPWGLLIPFAFWKFRKSLLQHEESIWFCIGFILLSLTPSKQIHYSLLILPPACMLTARFLNDAITTQASWLKVLAQFIPLLTLTAGFYVLYTPMLFEYSRLLPALSFGIALIGFALLIFHIEASSIVLRLSGFSIALMVAAYVFTIYPYTNNKARIPEFVDAYESWANQATYIHTVGVNSAVIDFYAGKGVHPTDSLAYAIKRAGENDLILGIGKTHKLNNGDPLPEDPHSHFRQGKYDYTAYIKKAE